MAKLIFVDPKKCDGCKECELACLKKHAFEKGSKRSRIRIVTIKEKELFLPFFCQHCEDPLCMKVCPQDAIHRDEISKGVSIDTSLCIGCKMCVFVCPFGAVQFDSDIGKSFNCDLCKGKPECVAACKPNAIKFVESHLLFHDNMEIAAKRIGRYKYQ